jgi:hypothetical protein
MRALRANLDRLDTLIPKAIGVWLLAGILVPFSAQSDMIVNSGSCVVNIIGNNNKVDFRGEWALNKKRGSNASRHLSVPRTSND